MKAFNHSRWTRNAIFYIYIYCIYLHRRRYNLWTLNDTFSQTEPTVILKSLLLTRSKRLKSQQRRSDSWGLFLAANPLPAGMGNMVACSDLNGTLLCALLCTSCCADASAKHTPTQWLPRTQPDKEQGHRCFRLSWNVVSLDELPAAGQMNVLVVLHWRRTCTPTVICRVPGFPPLLIRTSEFAIFSQNEMCYSEAHGRIAGQQGTTKYVNTACLFC